MAAAVSAPCASMSFQPLAVHLNLRSWPTPVRMYVADSPVYASLSVRVATGVADAAMTRRLISWPAKVPSARLRVSVPAMVMSASETPGVMASFSKLATPPPATPSLESSLTSMTSPAVVAVLTAKPTELLLPVFVAAWPSAEDISRSPAVTAASTWTFVMPAIWTEAASRSLGLLRSTPIDGSPAPASTT